MFYFFFNDTATTEIYTLSLHDALPIFSHGLCFGRRQLTILTPSPLSLTRRLCFSRHLLTSLVMCQLALSQIRSRKERKSTRLNSNHANITYAAFSLQKKNIEAIEFFT